MKWPHPIIYRLFILAGIILAVFVLYAAVKEYQRSQQIETEIDSLRQEAEEIRGVNQDLQEKVSYFKTSDFQEKIAKERLNLQKQGEEVAIIKPSISNEADIVQFEENKEEKREESLPNYKKWLNRFFK